MQAFQNFLNPEIINGTAEENRGQRTGKIQFQIKLRTEFFNHHDIFTQFGNRMCRQKLVKFRIVQAFAGFNPAVDLSLVAGFVHQNKLIVQKVVAAEKVFAAADGPACRANVERQRFFNVVQQQERVLPLAVHFIDERNNRNVPETTDFKQFFRLRFNAFCRVYDHNRRVHGCQNPVSVFGEVFVPRCIQQVKSDVVIFKSHY